MGNYLPFLSSDDDLELAYFSRNPDSSERASQSFGGTVLSSWDALADFAPDVVFNLTSDTQHAKVLDNLVSLGCPRVFTEKPLVAARGQERVDEEDFRRASRIVASARNAGVEIAMGFNYRFFSSVGVGLSKITSADFGAVDTVAASTHYACWSHVIDLIGMVCGPFATVAAVAEPESSRATSMEVTPTRSVAFTSASGTTGSIVGSARRAWSDELFTMSFVSHAGRVEWSDLDVAAHSFDAATGRHTTTRLGADVSRSATYDQSFVESITAYLDAVRASAPAPVPIGAGLRELQVEAAIAKSVRTGQKVNVQSEFPLADIDDNV